LDRMEEAIASQRRAVKLEPKNVGYMNMLADMLDAAGQSEEAEKYRQRAAELQKKLATADGR
jgi:Flp pilus assembly protein TadD